MRRKLRRGAQRGLTLVELMISLALGLLVAGAAIALFLSAKSGYAAQDESARIQETGRFALEVIARTVRQTAYQEFDAGDRTAFAAPDSSPNIRGLDAASVGSTSSGIDAPASAEANGSDLLALQFFGSGGGDGDGTVLNCVGMSVPAPPPGAAAPATFRRWSIFYVAKGDDGEPELRCKVRTQDFAENKWMAHALARGVESFQVLYGIDTDGDGLPNRYTNAAEVDKLDGSLTLSAADKLRKTHWKKVVAVKVALLLRGEGTAPTDSIAKRHDLFGSAYSDAHGDTDTGTRMELAKVPEKLRNRIRKTFSMTILLRNQSGGGPP